MGLANRLVGWRVKKPLGVLALGGFVILGTAACGSTTVPNAMPSGAPVPVQYSCAAQKKAANEFMALPPDSQLAILISDYEKERKELLAFLNKSNPGCTKP